MDLLNSSKAGNCYKGKVEYSHFIAILTGGKAYATNIVIFYGPQYYITVLDVDLRVI